MSHWSWAVVATQLAMTAPVSRALMVKVSPRPSSSDGRSMVDPAGNSTLPGNDQVASSCAKLPAFTSVFVNFTLSMVPLVE